MKEIILTGYSNTEVRKAKGRVDARCYLCKRKKGDKWVFAVPGKDGCRYFDSEMDFEWFEIIKGGKGDSEVECETRLKFFLCRECSYLLEAVAERIELRGLKAF